MSRALHSLQSLFLTGSLAMACVLAASAQQARQVDDEVLANAGISGEDWITYNINWAEHRHSPLTQINAGNIKRLGLAFSMDIPAAQGPPQNRQEGTPLVFGGVLYSITPWSVVYAVDARTGKELWHQDPQVDQAIWQSRICCGVVNRGIALYKGKVIAPVIDGRLRALDARDGKLLWESRVSPDTMPYTITMAPRVIKGGKAIVGVAGGEYGVRGFFSAYDAETGKLEWRFYTVPGDPSKPFEHDGLAEAAETWSGDWWKLGGGGAVWGGIAYDPDADLVYVATGQPGPWTSAWRGSGDNLYTNTILAVRGATGKLVWHYQEVPGDDWDYDAIADMALADLEINGKLRKVIMQAPKNGFFYVLDRLTGELLSAEPYVAVNWASGINMKTGRPVVNPEARYGSDATVFVIPGPGGGHVWPPMSFNPETGLVYIPGQIGLGYNHRASPTFTPNPVELGPTGRGRFNLGQGLGAPGARAGGATTAPATPAGGTAGATAPAATPATGAHEDAPAETPPPAPAPSAPSAPSRMLFLALDGTPVTSPTQPPGPRPPATPSGQGPTLPLIGPKEGRGNYLIAWDPVAQKERWRGPVNSSAGYNYGGTLSTAGNLLLAIGGGSRLVAYRADNGDILAEITLPLMQPGPPMTYMIDGKQYIVVAGGPLPARGQQ